MAELHDAVRADCIPILACFDVGSQKKHEITARSRPRAFNPDSESPLPSPNLLRREITFSSETDESYGLQLLSRIASDLQVEEGVKLIIPVAVVQPHRRDSYDQALQSQEVTSEIARAPYGTETEPAKLADNSDIIDPQLMLQCLDAGALDVVKSPLDKAGIMGLTVHAYRIYKSAKAENSHYMSRARGRGRKQSWVGVDEEKPYAYLRESMVRKLLKGICDPQEFIEDYQHRDVFIEQHRKAVVAEQVGKWSFSGQDFSDDELVYAGYYMLNHALQVPEVNKWQMSQGMSLNTSLWIWLIITQENYCVSCRVAESLTTHSCCIIISSTQLTCFSLRSTSYYRSASYHLTLPGQSHRNMLATNLLWRNSWVLSKL